MASEPGGASLPCVWKNKAASEPGASWWLLYSDPPPLSREANFLRRKEKHQLLVPHPGTLGLVARVAYTEQARSPFSFALQPEACLLSGVGHRHSQQPCLPPLPTSPALGLETPNCALSGHTGFSL